MKNESTPEVRERIKLLAEMIGGPSALSTHLGIHPTSVFGYLSGKRPITTKRLFDIAEKYPCSLEWLTTGRGEAPTQGGIQFALGKALANFRRRELLRLVVPAPEGAAPLQIQDVDGRGAMIKAVGDRVRLAIRSQKRADVEAILGKPLTKLVLAGKACPDRELLDEMCRKLGIGKAWLYGLED